MTDQLILDATPAADLRGRVPGRLSSVDQVIANVVAGIVLYWLAVLFGVIRGPHGSGALYILGNVLACGGLTLAVFAAMGLSRTSAPSWAFRTCFLTGLTGFVGGVALLNASGVHTR